MGLAVSSRQGKNGKLKKRRKQEILLQNISFVSGILSYTTLTRIKKSAQQMLCTLLAKAKFTQRLVSKHPPLQLQNYVQFINIDTCIHNFADLMLG